MYELEVNSQEWMDMGEGGGRKGRGSRGVLIALIDLFMASLCTKSCSCVDINYLCMVLLEACEVRKSKLSSHVISMSTGAFPFTQTLVRIKH